MSADVPVIAYFRGDDGYTMDAAVDALAKRLEAESGTPPERWRASGAETDAGVDRRAGRDGADVRRRHGRGRRRPGAAPALQGRPRGARAGDRARSPRATRWCSSSRATAGRRRSAALQGARGGGAQGGRRRQGVQGAQGRPARGLDRRTAPRSARSRSSRGAAKELARRVGGFVSEGDVDRQRQGALAVGELEKLALYRPVRPGHARTTSARSSPRSCPTRRGRSSTRSRIGGRTVAGPLLDRLLETTPEPVVIVQLHRRIRELLEVADHLAAGADRRAASRRSRRRSRSGSQKLVGQARRWTARRAGRRAGGRARPRRDGQGGAGRVGRRTRQRRLAFSLWIRDRVAPPAPSPVGAAAR